MIQTGAVTLGKDAYVGETTVLDIDTSMGDGAQLGHASSLHAGQAVPAGERWHGSPAERTDGGLPEGRPRRLRHPEQGRYSVLQLLSVFLVYLPLAHRRRGACCWPRAAARPRSSTPATRIPRSWTFYGDALVVSFVLFFGAMLVGLLVVVTVPRLLNLAIKPDKVYPAVRLALLGPPGDHAHDQRQVLHRPLRRQLLHRLLSARHRL